MDAAWALSFPAGVDLSVFGNLTKVLLKSESKHLKGHSGPRVTQVFPSEHAGPRVTQVFPSEHTGPRVTQVFPSEHRDPRPSFELAKIIFAPSKIIFSLA